MSNIHIRTLTRRIAAAEARYEAAKDRGETETYLAVARVKLDELKAALAEAETREASK